MELNDFIAHFAEQFEDTEKSVFNADTKFRELEEWSSVMALSVMAMIDDEYGIALDGKEMRQANTIEELFNIAKSKE